MTDTRTNWHERARSLAIEGRAFIDGKYVHAASEETFDCLSPIDGRVIAEVASTGAVDADRAGVRRVRRVRVADTYGTRPDGVPRSPSRAPPHDARSH